MSLKINLYDFFGYTIPGALYIASIIYFCVMFNVIKFDINLLLNLSLVQLILVTFISYIAGLVFNPLSKSYYHKVYESKDIKKEISKKLFENRKDINNKFKSESWPILLSYIKIKNVGLTTEVGKFHLICVMLRNISFSFLILGVLTIIQLIKTDYYFWNWILIVIFFCLSHMSGKQATFFNKWFYSSIYEFFIAYNIESSDIRNSDHNIEEETII